MRKRTIVLAAFVAAVVVPAIALASMNAVASAKLTGKAERPVGDPNGSGLVVLKLTKKTGKVCWTFSKVKRHSASPRPPIFIRARPASQAP